MAENLNFELVSPEEKLIEQPVKMAVVPGELGELGVGAGHASFVVSLQAGVVKLYQDGDAITSPQSGRKVFITGGFADISPAGCSVLAEEAIPFEDLNADDLEKKIADLEEDLGLAVEDLDKGRISKKITLEKSKLYAVQAA